MKYIIRELKLNSVNLCTLRICDTHEDFLKRMMDLEMVDYHAVVYNVVETKNGDSVTIVRYWKSQCLLEE